MKKPTPESVGRRSMMSGLGVAAMAGVALAATSASAAQPAPAGRFEPKRHAIDGWMGELPGDHRVFIDTAAPAGATNALRYGANILTAQVEDYQGSNKDIAMIICFRHASTPYGFNDAMWEKYGQGFAGFTQQPLKDGKAPNKNAALKSINGLAEKGVQFAVCNAATKFMSQLLAKTAGVTADVVHQELVANLVTNAHMVPAGVIAVTRSQEYGYSLLYSAV